MNETKKGHITLIKTNFWFQKHLKPVFNYYLNDGYFFPPLLECPRTKLIKQNIIKRKETETGSNVRNCQ